VSTLTKIEPPGFAQAPDLLWRNVPLDHRTEVRAFGVPVLVESNAARVIELIEEVYGPLARGSGVNGRHPHSAGEADAEPAPVRLRLIVEPTRMQPTELESVQWRVPDPDHVLLKAHGVVGWFDLAAADGIVYVEESYLQSKGRFCDAVIKAPVLTLVTRRDRHPIHAAAVRRGDAALLLHGRSGTGKSTLCYVASRAGLDVLSDDAVRVQLTPELRVWGTPGSVHLLDDAAARFGVVPAPDSRRFMHTGKSKYVVGVPVTASDALPYVRRARVCLLRRNGGRVAYAPASPDEIADAILSAPESQSDMYPAGRVPAAQALAARGGWSLTLSDDAEEALPHLHEMLTQL